MSDLFLPLSVLSRLSEQKARRNIEEAKAFLDNDFSSLAKILSLYSPLEVMKMAAWEERRVLYTGKKDPVKNKSAVLLPILVQSVVESNLLETRGKDTFIKEKDWERIKSISEDVVKKMARLLDSKVALALAEGRIGEGDAEAMRSSAEKKLLPDALAEGERERNVWQLRSILEEIPDFSQRYGTDYMSFSINVDSIARFGEDSINSLVRDVAQYRAEYDLAEANARREGRLDGLDEAGVFNLLTKENHWEGRAKNLSERRDGYSLFMPSTASSLPPECYASYSVKAGSLNIGVFLERGFWPVERYPFVEIDGKEYSLVMKHLPFFLSLFTSVERRLAASRDVLSIFHLNDCDTYLYDGNKIEISVLPSTLDTNAILYPHAFSKCLKRRDEELSLKLTYGHKRLVVDPDAVLDMEKKDDILFVSSAFLCRCTLDKNAKHELLTTLLGTLVLPGEGSEYSMAEDDDLDTNEIVDDLSDDTTTDEYEYSDVDEDELSKALDERDESIAFVEYEKKEMTQEEKDSLLERYSLTEEILNDEEVDEKIEDAIEEALDDDIFDDSEEEEKLDDIGPEESTESEFFEVAEATDGYEAEEKEVEKEEDPQLDFLSILDEVDVEVEEERPEEPVALKEDSQFVVEYPEDETEDKEDTDAPLSDEGEDEYSELEEETMDEDDDDTLPVEDDISSDYSESLPDEESDGIEEAEEEIVEDKYVDEVAEENGDEVAESADTLQEEIEEPSPVDEDAEIEEEIFEDVDDETEESVEDEMTEADNPQDETEEPSMVEEDAEIEEEIFEDVDDETVSEESDDDSLDSSDDSQEEEVFEEVDDETSVEDQNGDEEPQACEEDAEIEEEIFEEVDDETITDDSEDDAPLSLKESSVEADEEAETLDSAAEEAEILDEEAIIAGQEVSLDNDEDKADEEENVFLMEDSDTVLPYASDEDVKEEAKAPMSFADSLFSVLGDIDDEIEPSPEEVEEKEDESLFVLSDDNEVPPMPVVEEEVDEEIEDKAEGIIYSIYKELGKDSTFAEFIKTSERETLEELDDVIQNCWNRQQVEGKDKLFNIPDYSISILLAHDSIRDDLRMSELLNNAGGVMYARGKESWKAVIVYINSSYSVEEAIEKTITRDSFSSSDWKRVTYIGEQMRKK